MTDDDGPVAEERTLDISAMKAIAHPLRVAIYDTLSQYGAQTASGLGAHLGESSGATSYHLRQLAKHGLIREVPGKGTARERWWERPPGGVTMGGADVLSTPSGREASGFVLREMINRRTREIQRFFVDDFQRESVAWQEAATFSSANLRLTADQLDALNSEVYALLQTWVDRHRDQEGDGVRPVTVQYNSLPLPESLEGES
ncbi:ArsR family transcriptional regulator [Labedella gwakjiensis]|uniref:ArsR family transcriptional regulator n=1 Tax=Labedella gwakjiensis TaxID=390269 RepID=A0A2P8H0E7_9MICO|nr:helix-turn-helix domain-containing protein [Labedella gwakjiensis]PSL39704.1 ArsR family transcriptional regulator [Labedella gwakjiensis]RUQ85910.1 ArsR family transcriptional regulator [Labedella gwakjiensis]